MSREIVFDIETYGDIKDFINMKITVVSIYEYETGLFRSFTEHTLSQLWPILEKAERLIGYNSEHFDIPILNKHYAGDLMRIPHLDLLKVIKEMSGNRYKLNDIAKATLQIEKSADGLTGQRWYEEGKINELIKYCEQDVLVTKELYEYGRKNKMLYYTKLTGELTPIAVNFDPPVTTAANRAVVGMNMTLPL